MIYYDLREESKRKSIGNAVARETELKRMARTLTRQYNNNILIVGPSGTGKTALAEAFAYRIAKGNIKGFENAPLIKLDGTNLKNTFNQISNHEVLAYISSAFKELPENCIVFIDDFEDVIPENKFSEVAKALEPFLERTDLRLVLMISDSKRSEDLISEQPKFFQNFEEIKLKENDLAETKEIIGALAPAFEKEYSLPIAKESIKALVEQSKRFSGKKLPLMAIHFLDECLSYAKMTGAEKLSPMHVQQIFAEKTGLPTPVLSKNDTSLLQNLEDVLNKNVIGQKHAVKMVADIVRRGRMGLRNPNRPTGSFLFLGPSGVGKTELAKVLARTVYGSERSFSRIDMSEFTEQHTVQRLVGAPPGYVGYQAGGQLTNAIKEQPYSLILLDEIEKAHSKIFDVFLQVFDDGRLTDGQGQTVNFTNSIVVATSNLGIEEIVDAYESGINVEDPKFIEEGLMPILTKNFRLEFLNRFDAIIVFRPLSLEDLLQIAYLEISKIEERTSEHNIKFNIDPEVLKSKIAAMNDYRFGARPVKRFIEQTCENLIASKILNS